ncbi:MAG: phage tail tape measure protein [Oscillospiraceae bacterium]|nr:phage tail tape measure protein [Oscillospiraceae bacterium]
MPNTQADGEVVYRIRADTSQYKKDLKESEQDAKKTAQETANALSKGTEQSDKAVKKASQSITAEMKKADTAAESLAVTAEEMPQALSDVQESAEKAAEGFDGIGESAKKSKKESKDFSKELEEIGKLLEKDSKNSQLAAQKKKVLSAAISETSKKLADLKDKQKDAEKAFKSGDMPDEEYRKLQREVIATEQELASYRKELKRVGTATDEAAEKTENGLGGALSSVAGAAGAAGAAVGAAVLGVGAAAVGIGTAAVNTAVDLDKAMNQFAASTGTSKSELDKYQDVLEKIYLNNYGEDFLDIADSMAAVKKNLGELNDIDLQNVTEAAFMLRDVYQYDIPESTRATKAMMDNFGITGYKAMGLIAAGAQNGLDYSSELIDSISEYSVQFAKLGFTADDMFHIMEKGAETGAWNLDKVGDAIKEFSIRAIDSSDTTAEGFEAIGLNAEKMAMKFAMGGEAAKEAFDETIAALDSLNNPLEKDAAGVALFGTMWEDLGADVVAQLADIENSAYNTEDALGKIGEVKYDDLGSMFEALSRAAEVLLLPLGEQLIPTLGVLIEKMLPLIEGVLPPLVEAFSALLIPILELAEQAMPGFTEWIQTLVNEDLLPYLAEELFPKLEEMAEKLNPIIEGLAKNVLPALAEAFGEIIPILLDIVIELLPLLVDLVGENGLVPIIRNLIPIITLLAEALGIVLHTAVSTLVPVIQEVMDVLKQMTDNWSLAVDFINNVLAGDWEAAWQNIIAIFKGVFNLLPGIAQAAINGIGGYINGLLDGINKVGAGVGVNIEYRIPKVTLPRFHTGGILEFDTEEAPILAQDGEMVLTKEQQRRLFAIADGENLAVTNELDRMLRTFASMKNTSESPEPQPVNSENGPYIIYLVVDGETVAEAALPHIDRQQGEMVVLTQRGH